MRGWIDPDTEIDLAILALLPGRNHAIAIFHCPVRVIARRGGSRICGWRGQPEKNAGARTQKTTFAANWMIRGADAPEMLANVGLFSVAFGPSRFA